MRRSLAATLGCLLVAIGMPIALLAQQNDNPIAPFVDDNTQFVPLRPRSGGSAFVSQVFLNIGGTVHAASASEGVVRSDHNRLNWSGVPLIGRFSQARFRASDFTESKIIGEAYFADNTVWLDLSAQQRNRRFTAIAFLNESFAYRLNAAPMPDRNTAVPELPPGNEIGKVYPGNDGTLLVLVRPFIVTDSLF